jgi:acetylornithine aminotransferase/acetylornithine/N-succinyldiaminopimelate aminotransferase
MTAAIKDSHGLVHDLEQGFLTRAYTRYPLTIERGEGCYFWDSHGRRVLDFITGVGVNALGYSHPRLVRVIREQAGLCLHTSNLFQHRYQGELARRLVEWSGLARVFFSNSGSEAMEAALKAARAAGNRQLPPRRKVVALVNSFHGRSAGALSITGQPEYRAPFEPLVDCVEFDEANDVAALCAAVDATTAAVVTETIQGEGGIYPLTPQFLTMVRDVTRRMGTLWIADETQCGLGRTGWRFAFQAFEGLDAPDIIVTAKPLAGGLPLGATIFSEAASIFEPGMHGTTFGGGPLACRVALAVLMLIDELLPAVRENGVFLFECLRGLQDRHSIVNEVRGTGLMAGIDLSVPGERIVLACLDRGLAINCTHRTVLRLLPPYIVGRAEIEKAVSILGEVLSED